MISLAACLAVIWSAKRAEALTQERNIGLDLCLIVMISGMIGGRLFHVIFEYPQIYINNPLRVFRFWEGGFVYYGGMITAIIFGSLFLKIKKLPFGIWFDFSAPILAMTYAIGRIGCFLAGCCYGRYCSLPWAVTFPRGVDAPAGMPIHPTQLYAAFGEFLILLFLLYLEKARGTKNFFSKLVSRPGDLFLIWMMLHSLNRLFMESFRADFRGDSFFGLSISTILSLIFIVISAARYSR